MARWWLPLMVLVAACGSTDAGPDAPDPGAPATACTAVVCSSYPGDWDAEVGDDFISFTHPIDPARVLGTVGNVDMQGIVAAAGGAWPADGEAVVEAFFELLGQDQRAGLEDVTSRPDGSVVARGRLGDLRMWYRLIPLEGTAAIGVEVRAPNLTWQEHADRILDGVGVVSG